ncbi:MAG: YciI family protein [Cellulomonas sp.]|uniref:YCII-related domain-containing protein n=1 Tax=Cellulomonas gelida TaxID=1712 RepID=A0A4Y3KPR8_9CELL|nr:MULTISPECIES: YciI family protein [Cellulomonas]KMM45228.1 hypothetical protein CWIS_11895 [Cellulomonas sp. A375-1]MCR6649238.1 YciI family protein [Cellulomonas sp.]MCR6705224.1 YciI family protein [Cellulomonas sp.]GEA85175.1 hypothetical protein CGE01nite_24260 [Cellulomonas gelida]GGL19988.1 hypothetical protein GCM10009774_07850 [Cellulomonas gelida]
MTTATHLVLLRGDERAWEARTDDEIAANDAAHVRFNALAAERGHTIIRGEELGPTAVGKVVRRRAGTTTTVTDGPFGETTEIVGGLYLVATTDVDDLATLVADTLTEDAEIRPLVPHP